MATVKTKIRKILLVLLCMILVYTSAGHSFLGPGISQAATTLGTITATDIVSPIGGQAEPMATAATQVRNVLTRLIVNRDDVWRVEGIITRSGTAQLHKYSSVDLSPQELYIGVVNQMDSNNTIMFREYSGSYP